VVMHHASVLEHVLRRMQCTSSRVPISESSSRGPVLLDIGVVRSSGASNLTLPGRVAHLHFELASPKIFPLLPFPPPPPPINLDLYRTHHICYCLIVGLLSRVGLRSEGTPISLRCWHHLSRQDQSYFSSTPSTNRSSFQNNNTAHLCRKHTTRACVSTAGAMGQQ